MTLSTNLYVLDEVDLGQLFRFCQERLTEYDDRTPKQQPEQQETADGESWQGGGVRSLRNVLGQGLPAILDITYRPGGPLWTAEDAATCTSDCDPSEDYHYHPRACWFDVDLDTAYGYRDVRGWGCGDLHAMLVAEVGKWLDERGVRWEWRNEFTGEVHGGDQRYERLIERVSGGFEAGAWFRTSVLSAIAAPVTEGE